MSEEIRIQDSRGAWLTVTTRIEEHAFDAATYSDARGFTTLAAEVGRFEALSNALLEARDRREVCVLPAVDRLGRRLLITPAIRSLQPESRSEATRLMLDLVDASRSSEVDARRVLIRHFERIDRYPEPHVEGILDALKELARDSFNGLELIGFGGLRGCRLFREALATLPDRVTTPVRPPPCPEGRMPIDDLADFPVSRVWKGDHYEPNRILVLGQSWYGTYDGDLRFDDGYIAAWLRGQVTDSMYTRMANAIGPDRHAFWHGIAFTNYVQCVGPTRGRRPTREMLDAGARRLRAIIAEMKPRVVWLLGKEQAVHSGPVVAEAGLPSVTTRLPTFASGDEMREGWRTVLEQLRQQDRAAG